MFDSFLTETGSFLTVVDFDCSPSSLIFLFSLLLFDNLGSCLTAAVEGGVVTESPAAEVCVSSVIFASTHLTFWYLERL